ncbi:hypothetical protein BDU57DRAFT_51055 [Ampelomyces quisqualis]|uniref:Uncharacterized protein n=1 Tax=Ampelomyces quisqualis TaxID=50730 RepID=A0A6A5R2V1_AMPQU|nr:hypothetical protein BDU57DRAFT_51055 [Ampelomyces quisqualis]
MVWWSILLFSILPALLLCSQLLYMNWQLNTIVMYDMSRTQMPFWRQTTARLMFHCRVPFDAAEIAISVEGESEPVGILCEPLELHHQIRTSRR